MHKPQTVKLHVDERSEYRLRREMPWIFDKHADFSKASPVLGDLVAVYGKKNQCIRIGLYDPYSPIRVRILGEPCEFGLDYIRNALGSAVRRRATMGILDANTTGIRLLSGESEGLPGIVMDGYGDTWVVKMYTACWLPYMPEILECLTRFGRGDEDSCGIPSPRRIVMRYGRECLPHFARAGYREAALAFGDDDTPVAEFLENGAKFQAQVFQGQKTGFFLDQRNNRRLVRDLSRDKKVLDICCYSGGFSINAAMGGARSVWSLDGDRHALQLVEKHYEINAGDPGVAACEHVMQRGNMFEWLERAKSRRMQFDLVIADPPSFASSQAQIPTAEKAYQRLFALAADCLVPHGQILCCSCSSHVGAEKFAELVRKTLMHRTADAVDYTGLPPDHVANFAEARYLKAWLVTVK